MCLMLTEEHAATVSLDSKTGPCLTVCERSEVLSS